MGEKSSDQRSASWKGRGAASNPANRFERLRYEPEARDETVPVTEVFRDPSRSILSRNDSPDVGFDVSLNPYRGCEHGCIYCYARPTHEYLSLSAGLDFETRIFVKAEAAALLRSELMSPRWRPQPIALCGVTDPYQPLEREFQLTRDCLEVLVEFRNPVMVVTKSHLVTRDLDLLAELALCRAAVVNVSITTLDPVLQRKMEPRAASPARRLDAISALAQGGVPVRVLVGPVIPGLTDHELPSILQAAAGAGAGGASYILLRLPHGVKELFVDWLERHFPEKREKVLNRVGEVRGGQLNDIRFHHRMRGEGEYAEQIRRMFEVARRKAGLDGKPAELSVGAFRRPSSGGQRALFE